VVEFYASRKGHPELGGNLTFLGWATLCAGSVEEALAILREAFAIVEAAAGLNDRCRTCTFLALAEWRGGLRPSARRHILMALRLTFTDEWNTLLTLSTVMALLAEEDVSLALELYGLLRANTYCAGSAWWRDLVGVRMEALIAQSPPEAVEAAMQRGRSLEVEQTARDLVEKLCALGWEG
jgi:hypothetical protein